MHSSFLFDPISLKLKYISLTQNWRMISIWPHLEIVLGELIRIVNRKTWIIILLSLLFVVVVDDVDVVVVLYIMSFE